MNRIIQIIASKYSVDEICAMLIKLGVDPYHQTVNDVLVDLYKKYADGSG